MGFFDSLKKGFEEGSQSAAERQANSRYRTLAQQEYERYSELDALSDTALLEKLRSPFTSESDKATIDQILNLRGYTKYETKKGPLYRRDG